MPLRFAAANSVAGEFDQLQTLELGRAIAAQPKPTSIQPRQATPTPSALAHRQPIPGSLSRFCTASTFPRVRWSAGDGDGGKWSPINRRQRSIDKFDQGRIQKLGWRFLGRGSRELHMRNDVGRIALGTTNSLASAEGIGQQLLAALAANPADPGAPR